MILNKKKKNNNNNQGVFLELLVAAKNSMSENGTTTIEKAETDDFFGRSFNFNTSNIATSPIFHFKKKKKKN